MLLTHIPNLQMGSEGLFTKDHSVFQHLTGSIVHVLHPWVYDIQRGIHQNWTNLEYLSHPC
jgi:hypothetical protein